MKESVHSRCWLFKNSILINCTTTYKKICSTLWKNVYKCIKVSKSNNYKDLCIRHTFVKREIKNKDTWEFAHKYCGKVWYVCGMVMLPITVIFMLLVIGKSEDCVGSMGGIICGVQLIPLIGSILPTEIALKKNFDKNGTRR